MKKIFCLILIFIIVNFYIFSISSADGGLFVPLYRDIYEPNQLAMIVFDDSAPSWWTEVLIYTFSDERVTFLGATEEYNAIITPDQLKEYPILQGLIDETFVLTKIRKIFTSEEMGDDLVLFPVPKYLALGNIIDKFSHRAVHFGNRNFCHFFKDKKIE